MPHCPDRVIDLSPQQLAALDAVTNWARDPGAAQCFRLFGYAGTGKTTIAKEFASTVGGKVLYAAYTGKAALVLQEKGCPATTIHKLVYIPSNGCTKKLEELEAALLELQEAWADVVE